MPWSLPPAAAALPATEAAHLVHLPVKRAPAHLVHLPVKRAPRDGVQNLHRQLHGVSLAGAQVAGEHAVRDACDDQGSVGAQILELEATVAQDLHSTGLVCELCVSVPQMVGDTISQ